MIPTSAPDNDVAEATKKYLEHMQFMAAAWLADDTIVIGAAWLEKIEEFMVDAWIAMTDKDELLGQYAVCLGSRYNKLKDMVMAIRHKNVCALDEEPLVSTEKNQTNRMIRTIQKFAPR